MNDTHLQTFRSDIVSNLHSIDLQLFNGSMRCIFEMHALAELFYPASI